jgi:hypothetical protein
MANPEPVGEVRDELVAQFEDNERRIQESIDAIAKLLMSLNGAGFLSVPTVAGLLHIDTRANPWFLLLGLGSFAIGSISAGSVFVSMLSGLITQRKAMNTAIRRRKLEAGGSSNQEQLKKLDNELLGQLAKVEGTTARRLAWLALSAIVFLFGVVVLGFTMWAQ